MDDDNKTTEIPAAVTADDNNTSSVNKLHKTSRSENIAMSKNEPHNSSEEVLEKVHNSLEFSQHLESKKTIEDEGGKECTKIDNQDCKEKSNAPIEEKAEDGKLEKNIASDIDKEPSLSAVVDKKPRIGSAASEVGHYDRINRNQSDIFSLQEQNTVASSIFSVNGSPSRKIYRKKEASPSNVFPFGQHYEPPSDKLPSPRDKMREGKDNYNEIKRPSSSARNPLTGTGLSSNDEYKFKGNKRKDGNPLLGLGYTPEITPSAHRIPPGGYSHKLW